MVFLILFLSRAKRKIFTVRKWMGGSKKRVSVGTDGMQWWLTSTHNCVWQRVGTTIYWDPDSTNEIFWMEGEENVGTLSWHNQSAHRSVSCVWQIRSRQWRIGGTGLPNSWHLACRFWLRAWRFAMCVVLIPFANTRRQGNSHRARTGDWLIWLLSNPFHEKHDPVTKQIPHACSQIYPFPFQIPRLVTCKPNPVIIFCFRQPQQLFHDCMGGSNLWSSWWCSHSKQAKNSHSTNCLNCQLRTFSPC